jgi:hypothetical protein
MVITEFDNTLDSRFDFFVAADQMWAKTEGVLNKCGWIPFVGSVTGALRFTIGKVMVIAGLIMAAFKCLQGCFSSDAFCYKEAQQYAGYALHGFMNQCRGIVESIPFVNTITLVPYDLLVGRFSYSFEKQKIERAAVQPTDNFSPSFENKKIERTPFEPSAIRI